jgi:hypothetical protein
VAVAYKSQGAGVSTETSGAALSPLCPATVDANDILIADVYYEGTTTAPSTPSGWSLLDGPRTVESTIARKWVFGKIAAGTEDGAAVAFGTAGGTSMRAARVYSFSGYVSGTIDQIVSGFAFTSHATDPQMPTVTTLKAGGLAVALVSQNDNNALAAATGESGGDWVEAVAEYVAALTPGLVLQIQTCTPTANPGTVSGGAVAATNDPSGVIGFAIDDSPANRRGLLSFGELEVPTAPRRGLLSWGELEIPDPPVADRRGVLTWGELEVPTAPRRGLLSFAELEAPLAPRRGVISWVELQIPDLATSEPPGHYHHLMGRGPRGLRSL